MSHHLQGLSIILETRLSHSLLRDLLPLLHTHIHDTSVKVWSDSSTLTLSFHIRVYTVLLQSTVVLCI